MRAGGVLAVLIAVAGSASCGDGSGGTEAGPSTTAVGGPSPAGTVHEFVAIDAGGPLTKEALSDGDIDVAVLFTSSAGEAIHGWVHLVDDRGLQPAENFVPAVHEAALSDAVRQVLDTVSVALTETRVQAMMDRILGSEEPLEVVAEDFVADLGVLARVTGEYTVGRAGFAESALAGEIYAQALEHAGATVERTPDLGFREVYFPAVEAGDVDVMPEFVGSLLAHLGGEPTSNLDETLHALRDRAAEAGVVVLAPAPAESKDGLYTTPATAAAHALTTISDLAAVTEPLRFGGPAECPDRDLCLIGLQELYGLRFER